MIFVGHGCLTWAEQFIPSGMAALIIATIPIWMILFEWLQKRGALHWMTWVGIPVGLLGVYLLADIDQSVLIRSGSDISVFRGILFLTAAAVSWAFGSIYSRRIDHSLSLRWVVGIQMCAAGLGLLVMGTINGEWERLACADISATSLIAMLYLVFMGSILAYSSYMWLLQVSSPTKVGTYAYFNPVVAIILGALFAEEVITIPMILGGILILISLFMVNLSKHSDVKVQVNG